MLIFITTQYCENYGSADQPHWKYKGGDEYLFHVDGFKFNDEFARKNGEMIVDSLRDRIEYSGEMSKEYILDWEFVVDDYQTAYEKSQLELDGEIFHPAKRLDYDVFIDRTKDYA